MACILIGLFLALISESECFKLSKEKEIVIEFPNKGDEEEV